MSYLNNFISVQDHDNENTVDLAESPIDMAG